MVMDLSKDRNKLMELYRPGTEEFSFVDVPELPFAMIDGEGSPDEQAAEAIKTLYTTIYPFRRLARKRMGKSFVEPPVEMLYWADDMADLVKGNKEKWKWRTIVPLPVWIDAAMFADAVAGTKEHMGKVPDSLRMDTFTEGRCVQIMHVGSATEVPLLAQQLYTQFLPRHNLRAIGAYHEIYLDDWSRTAPEKRKIILRQPVCDIT